MAVYFLFNEEKYLCVCANILLVTKPIIAHA